MFCVARLSCPVLRASHAKPKARQGQAAAAAASRSPRGRQTPSKHQTNITDGRHWPLLLFYYGLPVYAPFRLHYYTARHGSSNAAAAVVLIKCFLHDEYSRHGTCFTPSRPISRTCIAAEHARATINVARRGKIRPHVYLSVNPGPAAMPYIVFKLPQLQHACLPACLLTGRIEC
jgi:hypothetical protein